MKKKLNILISYYSRDGYTKKASQIIAETLNADMDRVIDKTPRDGILGFLRAGFDATLKKSTGIVFTKNPANYDVVVIGTPVWNGNITPAIRAFLMKNRDNIKKAAFFVTCGGWAGKSLKQMHMLCNGDFIAERVIFRKCLGVEAKNFANILKRLLYNS